MTFDTAPGSAGKRWRKILAVLLCAFLLAGCGRKDSGSGPEPEKTVFTIPEAFDSADVRAIVLSDLHYTEYKEVDNTLVSGMALAEEITDAIIAEVIDRKPDVFIMTGDNTNSGDRYDATGLANKLAKIRDAGIRVILTTGNHDMNRMDAADFEEVYYGLVEWTDRDPASLSYAAEVGDAVFLAMDDNAVHPGGEGAFSAETMDWLREMLDKYRGRPVIWLSHHSVLYGRGGSNTSGYLIQNEGLADLLRESGVRLAMTGHLHSQYISEEQGLYEIISGMPFSGRHMMGNLAIDTQETGEGDGYRIVYGAAPVDFEKYAPETAEQLAALDRENSDYLRQTFTKILQKERVTGRERELVLDLLDRYFRYYGEGTLADHAEEIRGDLAYERMLQILEDYNYGPWIRSMVETTSQSGIHLEISVP